MFKTVELLTDVSATSEVPPLHQSQRLHTLSSQDHAASVIAVSPSTLIIFVKNHLWCFFLFLSRLFSVVICVQLTPKDLPLQMTVLGRRIRLNYSLHLFSCFKCSSTPAEFLPFLFPLFFFCFRAPLKIEWDF